MPQWLTIIVYMKMHNRHAIAALVAAGALWGLTVPLSKLALASVGPAWVTVVRFLLAAPLLAVIGRRGLRRALSPRVALGGAIGFGSVILLQNAGIERTSVSHAAVLVGAVPLLVALITAGRHQSDVRTVGWAGYVLALVGIVLVARGQGDGATLSGDLLVLGSAALSALLVVCQPGLLAGRDPAAVTAVQFAAGGLIAVPVAALTEPLPAAVPTGPALALAGLVLVGTLLPFWLFAFGQARVPAQLAGAYVNLEPVVGAAVGWLAFGNTISAGQLAGAVAVLAGIGLSTAVPETVRLPARFGRPPRASAG